MRRRANIKSRATALMMALIMTFVYSTPLQVFADSSMNSSKENDSEVVKRGGQTFYDRNGQKVDSFEKGVVELSKTIEKLSEKDKFKISLKVRTKKEVHETQKAKDIAVVLLLDNSNSMDETNKGGNGGREKLKNVLKNANGFLKTYAEGNNAEKKLAIVKFGTDAETVMQFKNVNESNNLETATTAISNISKYNDSKEGGTNLEAAMQMAKNLMDEIDSKKYSKHVILISDGLPTLHNYDNNDYEREFNTSYFNKMIRTLATNHITKYNYDYDKKIDIYGENEYGFWWKYPEGMVLNWNWKNLQKYEQDRKREYEKTFKNSYDSYINSKSRIDGYYDGTGGMTNEIDEKRSREIAEKLKNSTKVHTLFLGLQSGANFLSQLATDSENAYVEKNIDNLWNSLKKITESVSETADASDLTVTDPMGDKILYNTKDNKIEIQGNTLKWELEKSEEDKDGNKTYTYSYEVTLDTAAADFEEGKEYKANGRTTLSFKYGNDEKAKVVDFLIPSVKGKKPIVEYKIEFYKKDRNSNDDDKYDLVAGDTITGKGKLGDNIEAPKDYLSKYDQDKYKFVKGNVNIKLEQDAEQNVIKLYYAPKVTKVFVRHFYKTKTINENGDITDEEYTKEPQWTILELEKYVGDKYEAKEMPVYQDVKYTLDSEKSEAKNITVSESDIENNTINLYYEGTLDKRAKTSVTVNAIYETGKWELNKDGRYEIKYDVSEPKEKDSKNDVRQHSTYKVEKNIGEENGYVYKEHDNTNNAVMNSDGKVIDFKLVNADKNLLNITYTKKASNEPNHKKVNIDVIHHYNLIKVEVKNGKVVTTYVPVKTQKDNFNSYYVGETFKEAKEKNEFEGKEYLASPSNGYKLEPFEVTENKTINLYYTLTEEPEKRNVVVNHIYETHTKVTKEETDAQGKVTGTKEEIEVNKDEEKSVEEKDKYIGSEYTASNIGKDGYTEYKVEASKTITINKDSSKNVINIYYKKDSQSDAREVADITVMHKYTTILETVKDGKVQKIKTSTEYKVIDESKDKYTGRSGDKFTPTLQEKYDEKDFTVENKDQVTKEVTLQKGTNTTINIEYTREESDLKAATLKVTHKYFKKIREVVKGKLGWRKEEVGTDDTFTAKNKKANPEKAYEESKAYAGEVYTVDLKKEHEKDGVKETYNEVGENPSTDIVLKEGENTREFKYEKEINNLKKGIVNVNHIYKKIEIAENGDKKETIIVGKEHPVSKYVGEYEQTKLITNGYKLVKVEESEEAKILDKKELTALKVEVQEKPTTVTYHYEEIIDKSVKAEVKVEHYYRTLDWNENTNKKYEIEDKNTVTASGFKGNPYTAAKKADGYNMDRAVVEGNKSLSYPYTIKLKEGENLIKFYYTKRKDTREDTAVKVIHNYYKHDKSGLVKDTEDKPGVLQGTYEEIIRNRNNKVWVGNKYTADKKPVYGEGENELTYTFKDATPNGGTIDKLVVDNIDKPEENVIVVNYVYEYDASQNVKVNIKHIYRYYYRGDLKEETSVDKESTYGNEDNGKWNKTEKTFTANELPKSGYTRVTDSKDMTIKYNAGENQITIIYVKRKTGSSGGGGGSNTPDPKPEPKPDPDKPSVDIPDEDTPLGEDPNKGKVTGGEEPKVGEGDNSLTIDEEDVPLAKLPNTGGIAATYIVFLGLILSAAGVALRRKEN